MKGLGVGCHQTETVQLQSWRFLLSPLVSGSCTSFHCLTEAITSWGLSKAPGNPLNTYLILTGPTCCTLILDCYVRSQRAFGSVQRHLYANEITTVVIFSLEIMIWFPPSKFVNYYFFGLLLNSVNTEIPFRKYKSLVVLSLSLSMTDSFALQTDLCALDCMSAT